MPWDDLFDDLEVLFAAERDDARRASEREAERLRVASLTMRDRIAACRGRRVALETTGGDLAGDITTIGADWCLVTASAGGDVVVPFTAIVGMSLEAVDVSRSLLPLPEATELSARITVGFVSRALARSRTPVTIVRAGGASLSGTVDRAGVDHIDLAVHDPDLPRRAQNVRRTVVLPFAHVAFIAPARGYRAPFG